MNITWCTTQAILDKCVVSLDCDLCSFIITVFAISLVMYMTCICICFQRVFFSVVFFYKQLISLLFQSISVYTTYHSKEKYKSAVLIKKKATDDSSAKYKYRILQHMFSDCCNIRELHCTLYSLIFQTAGRSSRSYSVVYHDINLVNSIVRVCDQYVDISLW